MKKIKLPVLLAALICCMTMSTHAQDAASTMGSVTVFSDDGNNFTLYVNGQKKNDKPMPNVKAEGVTEVFVSLRVVFEDAAKGEVKKSVMRGAKDCTYTIEKNKKGETVIKVKNCSNPFPQQAAAPGSPAAPAATEGPYKATYSDGTISVSNGKSYTVTKTKTSGGWPSPHVVMNAPTGAKVTITYDDNKETYNTEVPFNYEVKDYNNNNSYFRLTVDEGGPDKTWYVRLQNGTGYQLKIE